MGQGLPPLEYVPLVPPDSYHDSEADSRILHSKTLKTLGSDRLRLRNRRSFFFTVRHRTGPVVHQSYLSPTVHPAARRKNPLLGTFHSTIAGHSLRSGGATRRAQLGVPDDRIQVMGRWASDALNTHHTQELSRPSSPHPRTARMKTLSIISPPPILHPAVTLRYTASGLPSQLPLFSAVCTTNRKHARPSRALCLLEQHVRASNQCKFRLTSTANVAGIFASIFSS